MDKLKFQFRQEAGSNTLDLYIYSEVCADYYELDENWNLVHVTSETSADYFRRQLEAHAGVTQINLYINSMGGSVVEGYGIYCQLRRHPAQKTAYIDGFACSIASIIACAAETVVAYPNSMMMIHEMMNGAYGNAAQLREAAEALDKIMQGNRQVYLQKSGGKLTEAALADMLKGEAWLTAQDGLAVGLVDEIREQGGMDGKAAAAALAQANRDMKAQLMQRMALLQTAREAEAMFKPTPAAPDPVPAQAQPEPETPPAPQQQNDTATLKALFAHFGRYGQPTAHNP